MEGNDPRPSRRRNKTKKMGMVRAYIAETSNRCKPNGSWMESTRFKTKGTTEKYLEKISSNGDQSCRSELERGERGSEEHSSVAVCDGCRMLQIGVTGNIDWLMYLLTVLDVFITYTVIPRYSLVVDSRLCGGYFSGPQYSLVWKTLFCPVFWKRYPPLMHTKVTPSYPSWSYLNIWYCW
jgi:hypothetical protein